jgi:mycothiol synthase
MQTQQLTTLTIRPFEATDYTAIAKLFNANFAEFAMSADEFQFEDDKRPSHCRWARWVAESEGRVVGFTHYDQHASVYHPRRFQLTIVVDPALYGRGIGRRLYDVVLTEVQRFDPLSVDEWSREDMACRVGFLERRGFVEDMRMWASVLDLTTFEPGRFADLVLAVEAQGIHLLSLAELGPRNPDVQHKLYDLWCEVRHDVPVAPGDVRADVPFEHFWEQHDRPTFLPAGFFVAVDDDQYVGESGLWLSPEPRVLRTGLTGVRRAYRRRGIASALKVRALEFAMAQGYREVRTENESNNRGMLGINEQLGFVKNPAYVHFLKTFGS